MILSNIHTHSIYCDGKNTPEEMVKTAISKGFLSLGFSGHAYTPHDDEYCMSPDETLKYIDDVNGLKEKYKDQIEIYLGTECDLYSEIDRPKYNYIIGSVHYVAAPDGSLHDVDNTAEIMLETTKNHFNNDIYAYIKSYFDAVSQLGRLKPDIIGHFDLVTKFNEGNKYFDENSKEYLDLAYNAMDAVFPYCDLFEVNTGAISRGYKTVPYPAVPILKRLYEKGGRVILTSDCHNAEFLDCHYKESVEILKSTGFKSAFVLLGGKFTEQPL